MHGFMQLVARLVVVGAGVMVAVAPAAACNPHITMSMVDQALASANFAGPKRADANALRADMAAAVHRNDQRRAQHVETQLMGLMGYVEDRPVSRSAGCARAWRKRD